MAPATPAAGPALAAKRLKFDHAASDGVAEVLEGSGVPAPFSPEQLAIIDARIEAAVSQAPARTTHESRSRTRRG